MCLNVALDIFSRYPTDYVDIEYNQYGEIIKVSYKNMEGKTDTINITPETGDTTKASEAHYRKSSG